MGPHAKKCGHRLHPAVVLAKMDPEEGEEISVQRAYNPESSCWGCGDSAAEDALHLQSYRGKDGLQVRIIHCPRFLAIALILGGSYCTW